MKWIDCYMATQQRKVHTHEGAQAGFGELLQDSPLYPHPHRVSLHRFPCARPRSCNPSTFLFSPWWRSIVHSGKRHPGAGQFPPSPLQKELEGTSDVHAMPNSRHAQVNEIFLSEGRQMRSIDFVVQESIAVFPQLQVLQPVSHIVFSPERQRLGAKRLVRGWRQEVGWGQRTAA